MRFLISCCLLILTTSCIEALPAGEAGKTVWSEWSSWSNCSRECGSGVSWQQRSCLSNCTTDDQVEKRYQSCCVQECPAGSLDFRQQQCLHLQATRGDGNWTLAETDNEGCSLHCQDGSNQQRLLINAFVTPGTSCRTGSGERGVCLGDQCAVVGCDGILGSDRQRDGCLRCLTEAESSEAPDCHAHLDTIQYPPLATTGNLPILNIPASSTTLNISHPLNCNEGRLALKSAISEYVFQGSGSNNGTTFEVSGVTFTYRIVESLESGGYREEITAPGPLAGIIKVELQGIVAGTSPSLAYTYHLLQQDTPPSTQLPTTPTHLPHPPPDVDTNGEYAWAYEEESACSASCGRGLRTLRPQCLDVAQGRVVSDGVCEYQQLSRPQSLVEACHEQDCPPSWSTGDWSPCSQDCGGGQQTRRVECQQSLGKDMPPVLLTEAHSCPEASRPADTQACNVQECHTHWEVGEWSQCSEELTDGVQCRTVQCRDMTSNLALDPTHCSSNAKPAATKTCRLANLVDSTHYHWVARKWRKCNNPCGRGNQTRAVKCHLLKPGGGAGGKAMSDNLCGGLERPPAKQECWGTASCSPQWTLGEFGECTGECCGPQLKHRPALCQAQHPDSSPTTPTTVTFPDHLCSAHLRPNATTTTATCVRPDCPSWQASQWSQCYPMQECGPTGTQERDVWCLAADGTPLGSGSCCSSLKPPESRVCVPPTCPPGLCNSETDFFPELVCRHATRDRCEGNSDYYRKSCCATCRTLTSS